MSSKTTVRPNTEGVQSLPPAGSPDSGGSLSPVARDEPGLLASPGVPGTPGGRAGFAGLERLALEARVATLEAQLEHKQRELEVVRAQYERLIDADGSAASEEDDGAGFLRSLLR